MKYRLGILASHPIQYQTPLFRVLAKRCNLQVFFAHRITPQAHAAAGFGVPFEWDTDLFTGYEHVFLDNKSRKPDTGSFLGCDTPDVAINIETNEFDAFLVMGWHLKCYWQAIHACHQNNVPVMVRGDSQLATPRGWLKQAVKTILYPWVIRQFDACLYVGQRNREYLVHYGAPENRLFFAPHCIDTEAFAKAAAGVDRQALRANWGVDSSERVVLFAGKLIGTKRGADLVRALAHIRAIGKSVVLVWAGDGPERQSLEELGKSLAVPMVFLGFCNQSQLPAIYRAADVLVLPSGSETWGLVVNEAMACGTPCLVSDACGCAPDMIVPGVNGAVFRVGIVESLAENLLTALRIDRDSVAISEHSQKYSVDAAANGIISAINSFKN